MSAPDDGLTLSLRECRLVMERIMQLSGVAPGVVPAARDCAVYSEALRLGGFAAVRRFIAAPTWLQLVPLQVTETAAGTIVDCGGQHAWLVAHGIADMLVENLPRQSHLLVHNVSEARELRVLEAVAQGYALAIEIAAPAGQETARVLGRARHAKAGSILQRIRSDGLVVPAALWWDLFELSNDALATDTPLSRQHAGPIKVAADGTVIGRLDDADDTDTSLLLGHESGGRALESGRC